MSEIAKTLVFVAVAAVLCLAAAIPQFMGPGEVQLDERVNEMLFPKFTDPLAAKSLQIVKVDEALAKYKSFKVSQINNLWVIPSHGNYPADAENQMRDVATSLIDLKILDARKLNEQTTSKPADDDEEPDDEAPEKQKASSAADFGVVEPDREQISPGDEGIGILISIEDPQGDSLLELIVGKEVKGQPELRWVRVPGQDVVYVTKIDLSSLSTNFEDWIEKDLLQVAGIDIERITLNDYSVERRRDRSGRSVLALDNRFSMVLRSAGGWELEKFEQFTPENRPYPAELLPSEELNTTKLSELKSALDSLEIVNVQRKPQGLSANLEASEEFMSNPENQVSLNLRGFYTRRVGNGPPQIYSSQGEVQATTKAGVQYVLRFGEVAGAQEGDDAGKLNRYLMVTTRVNEEQFPEPEYQSLPDLPAESPDNGAEADPSQAKIDPIQAEREQIQKENDRKREAYNEQRQAAADRVQALNARFANWYYVISEDTYQQIHLSRSDVIKESDNPPEQGFEVDAFRTLEDQGIEGPPPAPSGPPGGQRFPGGGRLPGGLPPGFGR